MKLSSSLFLSLVFSTLILHVAGRNTRRGFDEFGARKDKILDKFLDKTKDKTDDNGNGKSGDGWPLTTYRSIDGTDREDELGASHTPLVRKSPRTSYLDGLSEMDNTKPNPRTISNILASQDGSIPNARGLSNMIWSWGQFLDHDIDLSEPHASFGVSDISVPEDPSDSFTINECSAIPFSRSEFVLDENNQRQQVNLVTAFLDASMVYGSDEDRAYALRAHEGGKMNTTANGQLPPLNDMEMPLSNAGGPGRDLFLCGDIRCNEQVGLLSLHTLFIKEHNWLCDRISSRWSDKSDEDIYQLARKIVSAEIQKITYDEYLPAHLGPLAPDLTSYHGYDPAWDPRISLDFSTAIYRWGHSMVATDVGGIPLLEAFFNLDFFKADPVNVALVLSGIVSGKAEELDLTIVEDLRSHLFGLPSEDGCLDLFALNIQRAQDHGLMGFNDFREDFGLSRKSFAEITSDVAVQTKLASAYGNDVDSVDLFVGGLAEDHIPGGSAGETIGKVMALQFERLMHGDIFFYAGDADLQSPALAGIFNVNSFTFAKLLRRHGVHVSGNSPFFAH